MILLKVSSADFVCGFHYPVHSMSSALNSRGAIVQGISDVGAGVTKAVHPVGEETRLLNVMYLRNSASVIAPLREEVVILGSRRMRGESCRAKLFEGRGGGFRF